MVRKISSFLLLFLLLPRPVKALTPPPQDYVIENFQSTIEVNKDTSLTVTETIWARFNIPKHGIFRVIPVVYSAKGKTIRAHLKIISIADENGQPYQYQTSTLNQSLNLKIGDPNQTFTGSKTYVIKYNISKVLLRYNDHEEVYWNVVGREWDTTIQKAVAIVYSPLAEIKKAECFAGTAGSTTRNCEAYHDIRTATITANTPLSWGQDFTVVIALDKKNQLHFPNFLQRIIIFLTDNWGYPVALLPLGIIFLAWYKKGRDLKYLSDNIYIKNETNRTKTVSLFEREHLPLVYSPIQGLTPAQVGTIIDEKVDTKDIVAEIVELARLGFIEIQKTEKKGLIRKQIDYVFIDKNKNTSSLKHYQKFLLDTLFERTIDLEDMVEMFKEIVSGDKEVIKDASSGKLKSTSLSKLKNHFYQHLNTFKDGLYQNLAEERIFDGNPQKIKIKWATIFALLFIASIFVLSVFINSTHNFGPLLVIILSIFPTIFLILKMPRRTAWGHSLYRQITGLKFYIGEGKWREEIAEKNLFFEEILPLAICLGIVGKLAKDMEVLGVEPPSYLNGFTAAHFASDFNHFNSRTASNLVSSPGGKWSGGSSWSGGSGFSGSGSAGSGGGFGGGGGGSW